MRVILYNHRRESFHIVELADRGQPMTWITLTQIATYWRAPYYSVGRGKRLVPTLELPPDEPQYSGTI